MPTRQVASNSDTDLFIRGNFTRVSITIRSPHELIIYIYDLSKDVIQVDDEPPKGELGYHS